MSIKSARIRPFAGMVGIIVLTSLCSCASPAVVGQGASELKVASRITVASEMGYDIVETPSIPAGGFGAYFSMRMLADFTGASWQITYSSRQDLGLSALCVADGMTYTTSLTNYSAGFSTLHAYTATINADVLRKAASEEQHVVFTGNGVDVDLGIWPDLATAFLDRASPLAERWEKQTPEFIDSVVAQSSKRVTFRRDEYKKITWINTGKYTTTDRGVNYEMYASLKDGAEPDYYLKVSSARSFSEGWAFYDSAIDIDGNEYDLFRKSDVGYGGATYEWLHIPLSRTYLEGHRKSGLDMKVYGGRDSVIVQVPGWVVETLLRQVDSSRS